MNKVGTSITQCKFHFCCTRGSEREQQGKMVITRDGKFLSLKKYKGRRTYKGGKGEAERSLCTAEENSIA